MLFRRPVYLGLLAGHGAKLGQSGGKEGGVEEGGAEELQDLWLESLSHGLLQEADHNVEQGGGEMDTHLDHILRA